MTAEEAADFLGLSAERVRVFCQQGRLGKKISGVWVITSTELQEFQKQRRGPGRPPTKPSASE